MVSGTIWNKEAERSTRPVSTCFHCFRRAHSLASPSCHLCSASAPQDLDTAAFALPPLLNLPHPHPKPLSPSRLFAAQVKAWGWCGPLVEPRHWQEETGKQMAGMFSLDSSTALPSHPIPQGGNSPGGGESSHLALKTPVFLLSSSFPPL